MTRLEHIGPSSYHYEKPGISFTHSYLMPIVVSILSRTSAERIFELGCGNGSNASFLTDRGYEVVGVDPSKEGIAIANEHFSSCQLELGSSDDKLRDRFGTFDAVLSLEVVEHVFEPRRYAACIRELLNPGGIAIVSTPYHAYLKNLLLSIAGKWDTHLDPLWDYGHIKFWSRTTLRKLFEEFGLNEIAFYRVGRVPPLAKSMVMVVQK